MTCKYCSHVTLEALSFVTFDTNKFASEANQSSILIMFQLQDFVNVISVTLQRELLAFCSAF